MYSCYWKCASLFVCLLIQRVSLFVCLLIQHRWSPLHIACNKGMAEMTELLLSTARGQKNFWSKGKDSDCEDMINAKEKSKVKE